MTEERIAEEDELAHKIIAHILRHSPGHIIATFAPPQEESETDRQYQARLKVERLLAADVNYTPDN